MKRNTSARTQFLFAISIAAVGLAISSPAQAQEGFECILDTEDDGVAISNNDTDAGADANNTSTNLACGMNAMAGSDGENTALGSGSQAGIGAGGEDENTAVGAAAMAGVGDGADENTAVGNDAMAGIGAQADDNTAIGENANAGIGASANANVAIGESTTAGMGANAFGNTAVGESSDAGIGDDAINNTALGEAAQAGFGADKSGNTAIGQNAIANGELSDGMVDATAVGSDATANFDRSAAFGADAMATRANQMVYGTATETHTMPGITSAASRSAQSGPLELVTSDAMGNLATDAGETFGRIRANADDIDDNSEGIAMAMSIQDPDLVGDERLGLKVGWGTFSGENAIGVAASGVLVPDIGAGIRLGLAGGAAFGLSRDGIGGRAGLQLTW